MFYISKIDINLKFHSSGELPYWMGSTFRGGFGTNLREIVCYGPKLDCDTCNIQESCLFYYMYIRIKEKKGYAPPIKPIIIIPPFFGKRIYLKDDGFLNLEVLFIGDFKKYLPHVILAFSNLGSRGIGSLRHYGLNKFYIDTISDHFTKSLIYDKNTIFPGNLSIIESDKLTFHFNDLIKVLFKTPYSSISFPLSLEKFIDGIRRRAILFENEYGTKTEITKPKFKGATLDFVSHFHELERRSMRSEKTTFRGYTGSISYKFEEVDDTTKWLLSLGNIIGGGPDSSFSLGFFNIV